MKYRVNVKMNDGKFVVDFGGTEKYDDLRMLSLVTATSIENIALPIIEKVTGQNAENGRGKMLLALPSALEEVGLDKLKEYLDKHGEWYMVLEKTEETTGIREIGFIEDMKGNTKLTPKDTENLLETNYAATMLIFKEAVKRMAAKTGEDVVELTLKMAENYVTMQEHKEEERKAEKRKERSEISDEIDKLFEDEDLDFKL